MTLAKSVAVIGGATPPLAQVIRSEKGSNHLPHSSQPARVTAAGSDTLTLLLVLKFCPARHPPFRHVLLLFAPLFGAFLRCAPDAPCASCVHARTWPRLSPAATHIPRRPGRMRDRVSHACTAPPRDSHL